MPSSEGSTQRTEEHESVQNIDTTRLIEGEVANDSLTAKRKRGNSSKKATKSKKKPKQGSYGSMEQFIFRANKE